MKFIKYQKKKNSCDFHVNSFFHLRGEKSFMLNKRYDGRLVRNATPIQKIMPYIMKTRTDSMNMFEDEIDCASLDAYIKEKAKDGIKMSYMHIMIAAMVRMIALRPQLNRFVINGRIYARPKIWVSFVVHRDLSGDQAETTIKLCFEGTETILEIADTINEAIHRETIAQVGPNATDDLIDTIMNLPGPIIRFAVNFLMFLDRINLLPKAIIEASPFHTSLFITNLKSLGINHIFHHVYEFGTTGLFLAIGKEKKNPAIESNELIHRKTMGFGLVTDERFCDGLYYARSLRQLKKILKNPAVLEQPLDKKVEDVD